jgi:putative alpha-1,2-mannosidase
LEYAYNDFCIATIASELGYKEDAENFLQSSQNYHVFLNSIEKKMRLFEFSQNIWNPSEKIMCGKGINGEWDCPNSWLNVFDYRYVEGDAWHYRW